MSVEEVFERTAEIASVILGKEIDPHDVAIIFLAERLATMRENRNSETMYEKASFLINVSKNLARTENLDQTVATLSEIIRKPIFDEKTGVAKS